MTETITAAKETLGCGSAIASSSALTGRIIGKTVDEAFPITNQRVADSLGGLPPKKTHCGVMGYGALQPAFANRHGQQWHGDHEQGALACEFIGVDQWMIERAVVSTRSPPSSRSLARHRLIVAASHAWKQSRKCLCECDGRRRLHHGSGGLCGGHNRCPRPREQGRNVESRFRNRRLLTAGCGEPRRPK
ncbi:MAG TPA: iron-sulfur cluster assembly scaffold protein [Pseudaminobacter sp.]|nr:iron-sulfur cluster assembly scaffold protein [Pseudaminobacter sp.]